MADFHWRIQVCNFKQNESMAKWILTVMNLQRVIKISAIYLLLTGRLDDIPNDYQKLD